MLYFVKSIIPCLLYLVWSDIIW